MQVCCREPEWIPVAWPIDAGITAYNSLADRNERILDEVYELDG